MQVVECFNRWMSLLFGSWSIDDPRPIAKSAPYTFEMPTEVQVNALEVGDFAQMTFCPRPSNRVFRAERMWVKVTGKTGDEFVGTLENKPSDIPQLKIHQKVEFFRHQVIGLEFADETKNSLFEPKPRTYWDRCLVEDVVLYGGQKVVALRRETPKILEKDSKYQDSGWRIFGELPNGAPKANESRGASFVALGAVLNRDDSWLHLVDSPVGSYFQRNFGTGIFDEMR